ncbi:MAG: nucleoside phosphorylase [Spirosomataceae bacterium]
MNRYPASELVLNPDGSVYHLHLRPEHIADTIIAVGDPERVAKISKHFDHIEFKTAKREFVTHTGYVGKKRLTVISSGIGTDNVEILMNELDALVNIDLEQRCDKPEKKSLSIVRIGTSGCLQQHIPIDSIVVSEWGIGLDGLNDFYQTQVSDFQKNTCEQLQQHLNLNLLPYLEKGSEQLASFFLANNQFGWEKGTTLTCPGFYAPQGRQIRFTSRIDGYIQKLKSFSAEGINLTNFEMETAGYYLFANLLGHQMLSISAILANRIDHQFSANPEKIVEKLIGQVLEKMESL